MPDMIHEEDWTFLVDEKYSQIIKVDVPELLQSPDTINLYRAGFRAGYDDWNDIRSFDSEELATAYALGCKDGAETKRQVEDNHLPKVCVNPGGTDA